MKTSGIVAMLLLSLVSCSLHMTLAEQVRKNPLGEVMELLAELSAKVQKEGEEEAAAYKEYFEWCDSASTSTKFTIETATATKAKLQAKLSELSSSIEASTSKIEDLAGDTSASTADLKDATLIREKEASDFAESQKELEEAIDALDRAVTILEREMQKNPASFAQLDTSSVQGLLQSLSAVVDAAGLSVIDRQRLLALTQAQEGDAAEDQELGAPAAAVYKTHSSNIFDTLEDLKEKAESQLSDLRKAETNAKHNYAMLELSLKDQIAADTKDLEEEKASKAAAEEAKAAAEGDLDMTVKKLSNANEVLATCRTSCIQTAADHDATVKAREEELKVIAKAMEILRATSSGAVGQTYSLVQLAAGQHMRTHADLVGSEVVALVKRLAREHRSAALAQLASRVAAVMQYGAANGEDPFAKVKGLIQNLIEKLEAEAQSEATEKAYCDEELAKTKAKKEELDGDISKLTVKIDQATAKSAELKEEVQELQLELAALAKLQAEMDKMRQETHGEYVQAKADLELGVSGVQKALGVLREYYAAASASLLQDGAEAQALAQQPALPEKHVKATGAGSSIIGILEVVEEDFATNLAKEETEEADAQAEYEKVTQENAVTKTLKEQDVTYKTQEINQLAKSLTELSGDRESTSAELAAVSEYDRKLKERCIAKPETYEERKARRAAEIAGLKEALSVLENEAAFVQRKRRGHIRGSSLAPR